MTNRSETIGASEISALFHCNPYQSEYGLFCLKAGLVVDTDDRSPAEEARMQIGRDLEKPVLEIWARREGKHVTHNTTSIRNALYPGLSATPDAHEWDVDTGPNGGARIIATADVKTVRGHERREWSETGTPMHYRWQQQQQMMIDGVQHGYLVALFGVDEIVHEIHEHDALMEEQILERADVFWKRVRGELPPPPVDDHRATLAALMGRRRENKTVVLGEDLADLAVQLKEASGYKRTWERQIKKLKSQILAALGPFDRGVFADGSGFAVQMQERKEHTAKASRFPKLVAFKGENAEEGDEDGE